MMAGASRQGAEWDGYLDAQDQYLGAVKAIARLADGEEDRLLAAITSGATNASQARSRLTEAYQPLVVSLAKKHVWGCRFLTLLDLVQEGNLGLLRAIDRYNGVKSKGPFSAWAVWWIRCAMRAAYWRHERGMHLSQSAARTLRVLRKTKARFRDHWGLEPTAADLADALGLSIDQIHELLQVEEQRVVSLEKVVEEQGDTFVDPAFTPHDYADGSPEAIVREFMSALPNRTRHIVELRYGLQDGRKHTHQEIASDLGLAVTTVADIDQRAKARLRQLLASRQGCVA